MTSEIIKELCNELKKHGVRWLNGKDLGGTHKGSNHANMAVDFSETRLQVVSKKGNFTIIFGNSMAKYNELMRNPILNPFVYVNDGIRISFNVYHVKDNSFGLYTIGKNVRNCFGEVTNYTINNANHAITSSSINGDCGYKESKDNSIVKRNKEITTYFFNEFKKNDFYKEWEFDENRVRQALSKIKSI